MNRLRQFLKHAVTYFSFGAIFTTAMAVAAPVWAVDEAMLDEKLAELADAKPARAAQLQQEIIWAWERSGSDAMDLLYERGRLALEEGRVGDAIDHFTALIDHAPQFVQGYDGRAQAYLGAGLMGPAMRDVGYVLSEEPRHFMGLARLAQVLERTEQEAKALGVLKTLREVHPHFEGLGDWIARLELAQQGPAL